ncbi:unnamed protein product, partial [Polarella glacialis]
ALTANTAFEGDLASEIQQVNHCFSKKQQELMERTACLSEDISIVGKSPTDSGCADSDRQGLRSQALRQLVDILQEVDLLRKYAVWNAVAVVKILKKRRKQTSFGIEDSAAERAGWLSRQSFFSGSDFAELHASIESLGHMLVLSEIVSEGAEEGALRPHATSSQEPQQCPICLDTISDMVELSCNHRFCWKCFVLGPIAFQPGEYRITQCPICRRETTAGAPALTDGADAASQEPSLGCHPCKAATLEGFSGMGSMLQPTSEGVLTRFLHTYFPREEIQKAKSLVASGCVGNSGEGEEKDEDDEMQHDVQELVKVLLADCSTFQRSPPEQSSSSSSAAAAAAAGVPSDFFETLPSRPSQDKQLETAQKLQWLQLAATGDPLALDGHMYCALCSEPLVVEAVVTTPCKHHFHRVCISRIDMPQCPLCTAQLPFSWFLPSEHPCSEHGFRAIPVHNYRPLFPGGPSKGSCGYPLHRPPPASLTGPGEMTMRSYLHRLIPTGASAGNAEEVEEEDESEQPASPSSCGGGNAEPDNRSQSESSSEESNSEDEAEEDVNVESRVASSKNGASRSPRHSRRNNRNPVFLFSALGKIRRCEPGSGQRVSRSCREETACRSSGSSAGCDEAQSSDTLTAEQRNPKVLLIGNYL